MYCGAFAINFGTQCSLYAEIMGAMLAIELAHHRGWNSLWLETDSKLVLSAFKSPSTVPYTLRNGWKNCIFFFLTCTSLFHLYIFLGACLFSKLPLFNFFLTELKKLILSLNDFCISYMEFGLYLFIFSH
jgi:hypothetical protein